MNRVRYMRILAFVAMAFAMTNCLAQNSVLRTGDWFKFSVTSRGIYRIDAALLKSAGLDVASINPKKIRLFGQGGGMIPQANDAPRPTDLLENAILVTGDGDGKFDGQDQIFFFAEGPDQVSFNAGDNRFSYEHNLYANRNFYYLTISDTDGKRVTMRESLSGSFPVVSSFNDYVYHELDETNLLTSGREWFGEIFDLTTERTFSFEIPGIVPNTNALLISNVMAQTTHANGSDFKVSINGTEIASQHVDPSASYRYGSKGEQNRSEIQVNSSAINAATQTKQEIKYQYLKSPGRSTGYLNHFLFSMVRSLALYGNQTIFNSASILEQPFSTFQIKDAASATAIWSIADPQHPISQSFSLSNGVASFSTPSSTMEEFVVFTSAAPAPAFVKKISNQNLHGLPAPNLLIISYPDFISQAERLAAHRQSFSGINTAVVSVEDIYNEFSSGRQDVAAIRDFIRHLYLKNPAAFKSVLLFGRGSYDYKDRKPGNTNFVPTYESRNSLDPLETYSSDDFFGFMEDHEGTWSENPVVNHTLDIGVGRIPVKNITEAGYIVDKLIDYDVNKKNFGQWRKEITFVADDGNSEDSFTVTHQNQSNTLAESIESNHPEFDTKKIFVGMYPKQITPSAETAPQANEAIEKAFNRGTVIVNFTGHGSERVWTDERIFSDATVEKLTNKNYPFLITATCEFGRQDDPAQYSTAELVLLKQNAGAIGLVSTARPVESTSNFLLNISFYDALFAKENGRFTSIGEIFRKTKNNSASGLGNRNFSLLGDPSMSLALPNNQVKVTDISTEHNSDVLSALSRVTITGEVQDEAGNIMTDFNGVLQATLFDKRNQFKTIGRRIYTFEEWYTALFRGKASVRDGIFTFQFIVPKNIAYELGQGKLSLYASDAQNFVDATGADLDFQIGGSEPNVVQDDTPPRIQVFMGDTTFINGGIVTPDTYLVATLHDESGINISSYGVGNDLVAILDGEQTFVVNDYYSANIDNFKSGRIVYPVSGLTPGRHTFTVKAWDTYNNPAEATVEFVVTDGEGLTIESFGNYPNPVIDQTTFFFTHNRAGDDLQGVVSVFSASGLVQETIEFTARESQYRVELPIISLKGNGSKNLAPGLYLVRLVVRSLSNASKNERVTKLILLN